MFVARISGMLAATATALMQATSAKRLSGVRLELRGILQLGSLAARLSFGAEISL